MNPRPRVLILDHLDSFTHNLAQGFEARGARVKVLRPAQAGLGCLRAWRPSHLVFSPGPGRPESSRAGLRAIRAFAGRVPLLGVCLGHEALAHAFGAKVVQARRPMHGRASAIRHDGQGLFQGLPSPFWAGRYHSLAVSTLSLPPAFKVSAWTASGEIMGLRHVSGAEGIQFHPESILTPCGPRLFDNFLRSRC